MRCMKAFNTSRGEFEYAIGAKGQELCSMGDSILGFAGMGKVNVWSYSELTKNPERVSMEPDEEVSGWADAEDLGAVDKKSREGHIKKVSLSKLFNVRKQNLSDWDVLLENRCKDGGAGPIQACQPMCDMQ